ncbi:MAG TPA: hypothetical protein P5531_06060 [Bacteroidales bacterium]|nr:hypothetical protein [Bacteroidales bacterium]HSA42973.1 hypothetical protein [Bacteroidales bacterium]
MKSRNEPMYPTFTYHVYNKAVGKENLFRSDSDYSWFLSRVKRSLLPYCDILAYCLIPNHFHFLIRVRCDKEIATNYMKICSEKHISVPESQGPVLIIRQSLRGLFTAFAKYYNAKYNRKGKLFEFSYRRITVENESYFRNLLLYIHHNPIHHGLSNDIRDWKYSSFNAFISDKASLISRKFVLDWFEDQNEFLNFHQCTENQHISPELLIEESTSNLKITCLTAP